MDVILDAVDTLFLDSLYPVTMPRTNNVRIFTSLYVVTALGGYILYFLCAGLSYYFMFDHRYKLHRRFLPNQVSMEIQTSLKHMAIMSWLTTVCFFFEVKGYSKLYDSIDDYGWTYSFVSIVWFLVFIDFGIYWIHRGLHHSLVYKHVHKLHHKWIIPTPFASHAFHWADGFSQSSPYHIFVFLFPLHKWTYLGLFVFVNIWTVSIHDGNNKLPQSLQKYINGCFHHSYHHLYFNYNYGQFFTLWDIVGSSHREPSNCHTEDVLIKDIEHANTPSSDLKEFFPTKCC